uniref:Uncharacterized protein n=1 Tax=Rhizophora mucronata TaxID=61149 RepID=A0A2P2NJ95_RHIMU
MRVCLSVLHLHPSVKTTSQHVALLKKKDRKLLRSRLLKGDKPNMY